MRLFYNGLLVACTIGGIGLQASQPTQGQLDTLLADAQAIWGRVTPNVTVEMYPLNECPLTPHDRPRTAQVTVTTLQTILSFDDGTSTDGGTVKRYLIQVNSRCDWGDRNLDLANTLIHEYGHVLLGMDYHSTDPHSVMYFCVTGKQMIQPKDWALLGEGI